MTPTPAQIRALRLEHGLSMAKAAKLIDASRSAWRAWEYAQNPMPASKWMLFKILLKRSKS